MHQGKRGATAPLVATPDSLCLYLLEPLCMPSLASPTSRANFLPPKRTPVSELVPSSFLLMTVALLLDVVSRSTTWAGTFASTFLPCAMLSSTLEPLPFHSTVESPGFNVAPLIVTGDCTCMLALLAANALDAKNNADAINRLFDTVANFMTAPFSFPNVRREAVGAARLTTIARKLLCFPADRLQCSRWGSASKPQGLFCFQWGFSHLGRQTECGEIP